MSKGSYRARGKSTKARQLTFLSRLQHFINDKLKIFTDLGWPSKRTIVSAIYSGLRTGFRRPYPPDIFSYFLIAISFLFRSPQFCQNLSEVTC